MKLDVCGVDSWPKKHQKTLAMSPVSQFFHETSTCESVDVCGEFFFFGEADVVGSVFSALPTLQHWAERSGDFSMEAAEWQTISQPAKDGGQSYPIDPKHPNTLAFGRRGVIQ